MVKVQLPDGSVVEHSPGVTAADVIRGICPRVAREAVAAKVNGRVVDLSTPLAEEPVELKALTLEDAEGLEVARHSCAHVMAEAICTLWPETKLVYGPSIENGFYYDIDLDYNLTPADFERIEAKMAEIVKEDRPFARYELPREQALAKLRAEGNRYKLDNAERADGETISFYVSGEPGSNGFEDLCRGPHVPSTAHIGAFKVMQVAGAYYRGDAREKMLQRVYGTTWPNRKALQAHLTQLEEAKKRDHRKLGPELGLFTIDPLVGPGLVLWKPRGAIVRYTLETFLREALLAAGYQPVYTPHIGRTGLYRTSGHYPYYEDDQFPQMVFVRPAARPLIKALREARDSQTRLDPELEKQLVIEAGLQTASYPWGEQDVGRRLALARALALSEEAYLLKPMNCPHHIMIYGSQPRSYRELPVRLAEFGAVYRYEQSGEVSGLVRVRGFTQDDAHIFCTPQQLPNEISACVELSQFVLRSLGLNEFRVRIGLRDRGGKYIGSDEVWARAEAAVTAAVKASNVQSTSEAGEATFYGPKIDFVVKDCLGREWQLGTVQVDYNLPERFDLRYVGDDNREHRPVMVHRTLFGSMERFFGILIEHFAGAFPLWLAPVQATICTVSEKSAAYARATHRFCAEAGLRTELDDGSDRIGAKIRRATLMKVPYILVVGEQEAADQTVNVRTREGQQLGNCTVPEFLAACASEIAERGARAPGEARQASPQRSGEDG
jgi:threonyl-tRNA synthetase